MGVYMKKVFSFVLILLLIFSFNGCIKIAEGEEESPPATENIGVIQETVSSGGELAVGLAVGGAEQSSVLTVASGADTEFTLLFENGLMTVSIPDGALGDTSELLISGLEGSFEGCIAPGFLCEDNGKPGEHVELFAPAVITYWQEEPIPDNTCIVKYSDDLREMIPVPCWRLEAENCYGLMAEINSFSAFGVKRYEEEIDLEAIYQEILKKQFAEKSFIWRIEAENNAVRITDLADVESMDVTFYLRADSRRTKEGMDSTYFTVPKTYTGSFHVNYCIVAEEKAQFQNEDLPIVLVMKTEDTNLKLRLIPKFKKSSEKPRVVGTYNGVSIVSLVPPVFDGYIGWGTADMVVQGDSALGAAVVGGGWEMGQIPITVRVKGASATVRFAFPYTGPVELKGRFIGMEKAAAVVPAQPVDPAQYYSPGKPPNPPPVPEGDPLDDLGGISEGGGKITQQIQGGGSIVIIIPEEDEEEAPVTLESFYSLWNDNIYFSSIDWDNWEDDEEDDWDDDWEDDWDYGYYDDWDYGYEDWDYDEDWDEDPYNG